MDVAEARGALEKAIVDWAVAELEIDPDTDLLTSFAVIASFDAGDDSTRYVHIFPPNAPHHACIGLFHTAITKLNQDAYGIASS